ncbi:uncharacterized protein [Rutidosis leptorrhynchoides]|uniref:uncharacterized protein n=1 Tax=Rutidosis leptorrhynchoides TaxID=125765 RepID=UPI003A99275A
MSLSVTRLSKFEFSINRKELCDLFPDTTFEEVDIPRDARVKDYWKHGQWSLPVSVTKSVYSSWAMIEDVQRSAQHDSIEWTGHNSWKYSIASGYEAIRQKRDRVKWCKLVWGIRPPARQQFLLWLAIHRRIDVKSRLFKWGMISNFDCCFCGAQEETLEYLFFECVLSNSVWNAVMIVGKVYHKPRNWVMEVDWFSKKASDKSSLLGIGLFFQNRGCSVAGIVQGIRESVCLSSACKNHILQDTVVAWRGNN